MRVPPSSTVSAPSRFAVLAVVSGALALACAPGDARDAADAAEEPRAPRLVDESDVAPELVELARAAADAADAGGAAEWLELGMLYDANLIESLAEPAYAHALELAPDATTAYHLGRVRDVLGDGMGALAAFDRSLELDDTYAPTHWRRAECLFAAGRLDEAEEAFRRAIELEPALTVAINGLARSYLMRDDPASAVELLEDEEQRDRTSNGLLARAYRRLGKNNRADRALQREERSEVNPVRDPWTANVRLHAVGAIVVLDKAGSAVRAGEIDLALQLIEPLYAADPTELTVVDLLARALLMSERWDEALSVVEAAPKRVRGHFRIALSTGRALAGAGRPTEAIPHLERAVELNPHFGEAHVALGEVLVQLERFDEAEAAFRRALDEGRDSVRDWALLARTQIQLDAFAAAQETLESALDVYPRSGILWAHLADAQARAGDLESARTSLARAIEDDPNGELIEPVGRRIEELAAARGDG